MVQRSRQARREPASPMELLGTGRSTGRAEAARGSVGAKRLHGEVGWHAEQYRPSAAVSVHAASVRGGSSSPRRGSRAKALPWPRRRGPARHRGVRDGCEARPPSDRHMRPRMSTSAVSWPSFAGRGSTTRRCHCQPPRCPSRLAASTRRLASPTTARALRSQHTAPNPDLGITRARLAQHARAPAPTRTISGWQHAVRTARGGRACALCRASVLLWLCCRTDDSRSLDTGRVSPRMQNLGAICRIFRRAPAGVSSIGDPMGQSPRRLSVSAVDAGSDRTTMAHIDDPRNRLRLQPATMATSFTCLQLATTVGIKTNMCNVQLGNLSPRTPAPLAAQLHRVVRRPPGPVTWHARSRIIIRLGRKT
ncbi:uncharacterized protein CC84DRAFT_1171805 [Paraphaeosphaeria sporulosa]|uniref:Uncharacterized protein n=1 Tax=Paraphaeosphaeria sporulosa TaxID=1460663 RepID=A0A177CNU6_9PLEO|nr:uncharacterized protein CC84DRAFT_1171805 [Paraphaeosphaeria sporulosa]OAG09193.1 hypothetical protein CC84DRAFT_1171805 [Paraphaeosphaeria sporulosa]